MIYLKYLLGLIGILLLIVIGRGLLTPTLSYSSEVSVDKPIKEAWAVMNDESKIDQWLKGISKIEHVSGKKGAVGSVTKYTFNDNGTESQVVETMKTIRPNEYVAMDFTVEGVMNMDYEVDFSENAGKTLIKSSTTTKGANFMMRCMLSFMKGSMQSQEDENMGNLKTLIDNNKTDYYPAPIQILETEAQQ